MLTEKAQERPITVLTPRGIGVVKVTGVDGQVAA